MIVFFDASSLIKLYIDEPDAQDTRRLAADSTAIAVSLISWVEVTSAFARRRREGFLTDATLDAALDAFRSDWPSYVVMNVDEIEAAFLTLRHPLRAMDAIQLAAARGIADVIPASELIVSCHDARLAIAARDEGMTVRP
ncbi:MAG: type II toxin-antitoxin system VapC family toxin [Ardenticatenales bacterium]